MSKTIAISSGHGKQSSGAVGILNEVTENRRVVTKVTEYLRKCGAEVFEYHDDAGTNATQVINNIVSFHNSKTRDIDVSVHFNAFQKTENPMGTEVLYKTEKTLAEQVSKAIADVSGLKNRGAKLRNDLTFLNATKKPAILIEICFVDSEADVKIYQEKFDEICRAIAETVSGKKVNDTQTGTPIMGKSILTAEQMSAFLLSKNIAPIIKCTPLELAQLYITEANIEGVRGDIAFCQAIQETGWFKYGNAVKPEQNNYCGLGVTGNGVCGEKFNIPQLGVRAHIQHLKAYADKEALKNACVDPRFSLVTRGIASTFEQLGGKWAVPGYDTKAYTSFDAAYAAGATYGQSILKIYADMSVFKAPAQPLQTIPSDWAEVAWEWAKKQGITDGTNPQGSITREQTVTMLWRFAKLKGLV